SGNTEEALSSFSEATKKNAAIIALTSGGKLLAMAKKYGIPVVLVPAGILPRFALGYLTGATLGILTLLKVIKNPQKAIIASYKKVGVKSPKREAKKLACFFTNKIPLVYTTDTWSILGHLFKISFNETAKIPAFSHVLPEMNHNELQGFAAKPLYFNKNFVALFLKEKNLNRRLYKRFQLTQKFLYQRGQIHFVESRLPGNNFWENLIYGASLAYWTGYFVSQKRSANPMDDSVIEEFKALMA
ncbi:MAG: SIS domain-containing protein, partial [Candidatus Paceibacteria bacterium]